MQTWEYLFVVASNSTGLWRPHFLNDTKLDDWEAGQTLSQFANELGEQGWEMVGITYGATETGDPETGFFNSLRLVFKRPKP